MNFSLITPGRGKLVIQRDKKYQSSILEIVEQASAIRPVKATVLAVGKPKVLADGRVIDIEYQPGDRVFVSNYPGAVFEYEAANAEGRPETQRVEVVTADDILGRLNEGA